MQARRQFDTGVDTGRNDAAPERAEPGGRGVTTVCTPRTCATPRSLAGILTSVLASTLGLVPFAIPMTADAQNAVTIWSATLTPRQFQTGPTATGYGYNSRLGGSLSDTDFVYSGTTYTITSLQLEWVYGGTGYWRAGMGFDSLESASRAYAVHRAVLLEWHGLYR